MTDLAELKRQAEAQVAGQPRYAGMFDRYIPVRLKRTITTKQGVAFEEGEVALAAPDSVPVESGPQGGRRGRLVWSMKHQVNAGVYDGDLEFLSSTDSL